MKKSGYTLAESLVSLAIIGMIAAILLPMVNKFKPDRTKAMYLKTYDSLVQIINSVASDTSLYPEEGRINSANIASHDFTKVPLMNFIDNIQDDRFPSVLTGGQGKLCRILSMAFSNEVSDICSDNNSPWITQANNNYMYNPPGFSFVRDFTSLNGVDFMVRTYYKEPNQNNPVLNFHFYQTDVFIDVNGEKGKNCTYEGGYYGTTNPNKFCTDPSEVDQFRFTISSTGQVRASDPVGKYFLDTRVNLKKFDPKAVTLLVKDGGKYGKYYDSFEDWKNMQPEAKSP